jgi:hypothetical protein
MQKELKVTIKGITPLLQGKMGVDEKSPVEEKAYKQDGEYCFPFTWIIEAIKAMSKREKEPGRRGGSYFKTIAAAVQIEPEWIILNTSKLETYGRYLKTKMRGDRVWAESPMFKEWEATFKMIVDTSIIKPDKVLHFLEEAGRLNGVGCWRPERGGRFGKFILVK